MTLPAPAGTPGHVAPGPIAPDQIAAGDWTADPAGSTVSFTVTNFGVRKVTGHMPLTSATVTIGPDGRPVSVRAEIHADGIDTGHRRRDDDLRRPRFLGTSTQPAISYTADRIEPAEAGWVIDGTLRVKDTPCAVRLAVAAPARLPSDPQAPVEVRATGQVDRRAAGVTTGPAFLIGHLIAISLTVWLRPPAAACSGL